MSLPLPVTVSPPLLAIIDSHDLGPGTLIGGTGGKSHAGAIAGGVAGGIAAICILVAAISFYRRRRRSQALSAASAGDGAFKSHMDPIQRPMSVQGTIGSLYPETTSLMSPYVRVFVPPSSTYAQVFFYPSEPG